MAYQITDNMSDKKLDTMLDDMSDNMSNCVCNVRHAEYTDNYHDNVYHDITLIISYRFLIMHFKTYHIKFDIIRKITVISDHSTLPVS